MGHCLELVRVEGIHLSLLDRFHELLDAGSRQWAKFAASHQLGPTHVGDLRMRQANSRIVMPGLRTSSLFNCWAYSACFVSGEIAFAWSMRTIASSSLHSLMMQGNTSRPTSLPA